MEENLILLGLKIKKDPETYKDEFLAQLKTFNSLISLPSPPIKQIKPMIFFIVRHCSIDPVNSTSVLISALETVTDYPTKKVILSGLIIVRQKKLIESKTLLKLIISHGNDLRYFLRNVQEFLDVECYEILVDWYNKGTERQKCFCYFLLLVLFSKIHDVNDRRKMEQDMLTIKGNTEVSSADDEMDSLSEEEQSDLIDGDDILSGCDEESEEEKRPSKQSLIRDDIRFDNSRNTIDLDELENIVVSAFFGITRITKICCLYFLNRTEIKFDITKIKFGSDHAKKLYKELSENVIDREVKLMKLKIFVLFKEYFKVKKSVIKIILKMIDLENEDLKDLLDCLVRSVARNEIKDVLKTLSEEFVHESKPEEIVVYGMNVMREIYSRFKDLEQEYENEEESNTSEDNFISELKSLILKYVECFQGNRTKSIFYAYRLIVKVLINNEIVEKAVTHVKKKSTKEEKTIKRNKGKEEIKRLRAEAKRHEKQEIYKRRTKGRKKVTMMKYMMKPTAKKNNKKRR